MIEIEKLIDMKKHVVWSKRAEEAVMTDLRKRFPSRVEELWEKTVCQYAEYLRDQPYVGGKKNRQAGSIYDSILGFAYYEALPEKPTLPELEEVMNAMFVPVYEKIGSVKFANVNHTLLLRVMNKAFKVVEKSIRKNEEEWVGNYHMEVEPFSKEHGIRYKFHTCPIADFAKRIGRNELMPAFCNGDYPMLKCIHAHLIRTYTCANGPYCDYWIVGDGSEDAKSHPEHRDEEGYIRN